MSLLKSLRMHGEICRESNSSFIWKISEFINKTRDNFLYSEDFHFNGETWYLYFYEKYDDFLFHLSLRLSGLHNSSTVTYKLCLKDRFGVVYWSSRVLTQEFRFSRPCGGDQKICKSDLQRNQVFLHLIFDPPREEDVNSVSAEQSEASCHVLSAVASNSSLPCNRDPSPIIDGLETLSLKLTKLFLTGQDTDVTFNVRGKEFKVHKPIIIAQSPVLEKMFVHNMVEKKSSSVQIPDCDPDMFYIFLLFLYSGKVETLTVESAVELYYIAHKYEVEVLASNCVKFLRSNFSREFFTDIVSLGLLHSERELLECANLFFIENMTEIVNTDKWKSFIRENPDIANELLIKALSKVKLTPKSEVKKIINK